MIYLPNDSLDPAYNQAFEECAFELPIHEEILLVWQNRPSVICGRYQNVFQETHLPTVRARNVDVVRRMTGGGCVYHDLGNVNYALIFDAESSGYDGVLDRMIAALNAMGVPAERSQSSALAIAGMKISGSAQRVHHGRLLHHGTLLYDVDLSALRGLANGHSECYRSRAICSAPAPVTNIREHLTNGGMDAEEFHRRLVAALAPDEISQADFAERAEQLAREKYRSWDWNFGQSPKFSFARDCAFMETNLHIRYDAQRAVLQNVRVECAEMDGAGLSALLEGRRLEPETLRPVLEDFFKDSTQAEHMLDRLF